MLRVFPGKRCVKLRYPAPGGIRQCIDGFVILQQGDYRRGRITT